jgi:hypothetical protein
MGRDDIAMVLRSAAAVLLLAVVPATAHLDASTNAQLVVPGQSAETNDGRLPVGNPLRPDAQPPAPTEVRLEDLPWPVRIGVRAATLELALPVAQQVVLVPDEATWLDEIARWTPTARWPVLFDDDRYAPLFIRAFQPDRVLRRSSVGALPEDRASRQAAMDRAVANAWGSGAAVAGSIDSPSLAAIKAARLLPPGIVVTSADDPAWTAGVALSAGRGLPIYFVDGDFGEVNGVLDADGVQRLDNAIRGALDATQLPYAALGDAIDAIALCRTLPARAVPNIPVERRVAISQDPSLARASDPLATVDCLARDASGARFAVVGWIPGPSDRAAYMAMCSLFLARDTWWFISGYTDEQPWSLFAPANAAKAAEAAGFTTKVWTGEQATISAWRKLLMGGFASDLLVVNSMGDPDWFGLVGNERGRTADVPFLQRPTALHLIHSWSLKQPFDRSTVGGRFLERGVYAYAGSVHEPLLMAFVPPPSLAARWTSYGPFLVSSRLLDGMFDRPWRVTLIGDPLMTTIPPAKRTIQRASMPEANGDDVRTLAADRMRRIAAAGATPAAEDLRLAMRDLVLLGSDEIATGLWQLAQSKGLGKACALEVLPAIFRRRAATEFIAAFRLVDRPSDDARDMLWHLCGPRASQFDRETLRWLVGAVRRPDPTIDLAAILPAIDKADGRLASARIVQREMDQTNDPNIKARLSELLRR